MKTTNHTTGTRETKRETFKRLQKDLVDASEQSEKYFLRDNSGVDYETAVGDLYCAEQDFLNFCNAPEYSKYKTIKIINGQHAGQYYKYDSINACGYELTIDGASETILFRDACEIEKNVFNIKNYK